MKYYAAALTAFVLWGFVSFAVKPLAAYSSLDILFYRVFACAILLLVVAVLFRLRVTKENIRKFRGLGQTEKKRFILLTLAGGVFLTTNWFFFIYLVNHISVKAGSLSYLVCPILTTVLAFFLLNEKLSREQWVAVGVSAAACGLLAFDHPVDLLYSLIVAVSYAFYLVSQRRNTGFDKLTVLTLHVFCASLILLPLFFSFSEGPYEAPDFYGFIVIIAVVFTIIPLYLNLYALQKVNSSTMGVLLYINPLINFTAAILYFKEEVTGVQATSYLLILVSVALFNRDTLMQYRKRKLVSEESG